MSSHEVPPVVLCAHEVHKQYRIGRGTLQVLKGVDLEIRRGEQLSIMGSSGSGKSTLLHVIGSLDRPDRGRVEIGGRPVYALRESERVGIRSRRIGFVFQAYHLLPELDVLENVVLPAMAQRGWTRRAAEIRKRAGELLERVGLAERSHHRPAELSGGEQQRAAIARAMINDPDIILADEPTGNLDARTGEQVLEALLRMSSGLDRTLVVVTHDESVGAHCARRMTLSDGKLTAL